MNNEFIEIQTDRDDLIIYLLSRYDIHVYIIYVLLKDDLFCFLKKLVFISSLFFVLE